MSLKQQEHVVASSGSPQNEDRFTVVLSTHYLEWDTGAMTDVRWAYDRRHPTGNGTCFQTTLRVDPGKKKKIELPEFDLSRCEIILGHRVPKMSNSPELAEMIAEQQKSNLIEVWDSEKMIAVIGKDRMMFGQFSGDLYVSASNTTAILHITAAPL